MKNKSMALRLMILRQHLLRVIQQTWLLPRTVAVAFEHRRIENARQAAEVERLDRIRNPADYLGK